jgi:hypothetical protein
MYLNQAIALLIENDESSGCSCRHLKLYQYSMHSMEAWTEFGLWKEITYMLNTTRDEG